MTKTALPAILALVLVGCGSSEPTSTSVTEPPQDVLSITTPAGTFTSVVPAILKRTPSSLALVLSGSNGAEQWHANATLSLAHVTSGSGTLTISDTAEVIVAVVGGDSDGSATTNASAGAFSFQLRKGGVSGQVTDAQPATLGAEFDGALSTECWVPQSALSNSNPGGGITPDDGTEPLVLDENLTTTACQDLAAWQL